MIAAVRPGRPPRNRHRHVGVELHQLPAQQGLLAILFEVLLLGRAADFVHVREDVLQGAVFLQQVAGRLGADQRHARHVVGRVADQGLVIDDLVRRDAPLLPQDLAIDDLVLADVVELHVLGDQLPAVLVAADDETPPAQLLGQPGDRGHDVVGLEALVGQQGNAQGLDHAMHEADLRHEVLVHVGPARLVLLVKLVAKGLARQVEGTEQKVRLLRFQQIEQVPRKAIDGIHRLPAGAGHVRDGVEDLVDQGMGIDDPDRLPGKAFGRRRGRFGGRRIGLQPVAADHSRRKRLRFRARIDRKAISGYLAARLAIVASRRTRGRSQKTEPFLPLTKPTNPTPTRECRQTSPSSGRQGREERKIGGKENELSESSFPTFSFPLFACLMSKEFRRVELLLPLRFNDGEPTTQGRQMVTGWRTLRPQAALQPPRSRPSARRQSRSGWPFQRLGLASKEDGCHLVARPHRPVIAAGLVEGLDKIVGQFGLRAQH